jgi:hypothetical protein
MALTPFVKGVSRGGSSACRSVVAKTAFRRGKLCLSEVMTIVVGFLLSGYRTLKTYYRALGSAAFSLVTSLG